MRRLADELGVVPGTLYTYVTNRTVLLTLVLDTVVARDELPHEVPGTWRERLEAWARTDFDHFCAKPWVLTLRSSVRDFGPSMVRWFDSALRVFEDFDVPEDVKMHMIGTLDAYVVGSAFSHLETVVDPQPAPDLASEALVAYEAAPALQKALAGASPTFHADRFEFGLAALLDGFAAALHRRE